jgi:hypothetical protein
MGQVVEKQSHTQFVVYWEEQPEVKLTLSFDDIIRMHKLSGQYCLIHWQAKPFGLRRFGVYDSLGRYTPLDWNQLIPYSGETEILQVDETLSKRIPVAVMCIKKHRLELVNSQPMLYALRRVPN